MRDQDLAFLESNPYDDHSPYDDNFGSGPSRPAPMPYDDPYSDDYNNAAPAPIEQAPPPPRGRTYSIKDDSEGLGGRTRGRGRGRGSGFDRSEGRGRGRGRERGRGRGNNDRPPRQDRSWDPAMPRGSMEPYDPHHLHQPRPLSPTSMAIARATGEFPDGSGFTPQSHSDPSTPTAPWAFDPSQQLNFGYQQPFVQPHINPRFASAFGMNLNFQHPQPYYQPPGGSNWTDEWTVHSGGGPGNDSSNSF